MLRNGILQLINFIDTHQYYDIFWSLSPVVSSRRVGCSETNSSLCLSMSTLSIFELEFRTKLARVLELILIHIFAFLGVFYLMLRPSPLELIGTGYRMKFDNRF